MISTIGTLMSMNGALIKTLIVSLILTLIFEISVFLLAGKRNKNDLLLVVLVNILTNPAVVLTYWLLALYASINLLLVKILLEFLVFITEGYYHGKYGMEFNRPYLFSVVANVVSFGAGILLQRFWVII